jgi:DNA primase
LVEAAQEAFAYRIELYRRQGRLVEAPERTAVARELLDSLITIPDSIRQELAAQEAARKIGLSVETMLRELAVRRVRARRKPDKEALPPVVRDAYTSLPPIQRNLLEVLIRWPELRDPVFAEITAAEFQAGLLRRIASKLEESCISGHALQGEEMIREDTPLEDVGFISQALAQTEVDATRTTLGYDRKAMRKHVDFRSGHGNLNDLLMERLEKEYKQLNQKIASENSKDRSALTKNMAENRRKKLDLSHKTYWPIPADPSMDVTNKMDQIKERRKAQS